MQNCGDEVLGAIRHARSEAAVEQTGLTSEAAVRVLPWQARPGPGQVGISVSAAVPASSLSSSLRRCQQHGAPSASPHSTHLRQKTRLSLCLTPFLGIECTNRHVRHNGVIYKTSCKRLLLGTLHTTCRRSRNRAALAKVERRPLVQHAAKAVVVAHVVTKRQRARARRLGVCVTREAAGLAGPAAELAAQADLVAVLARRCTPRAP